MSVIVEKVLVLAISALISLAAISVLVGQILPLVTELLQRYWSNRNLSIADQTYLYAYSR